MTTINSDYIKANVKCIQCNSNNLKRNYKKSFKSPYNSEGDFIPEIMEWRQFKCKSCDQHTNVLNNKDKIILISEEPVLPLCAFTMWFQNPEKNPFISILYHEDISYSYHHNVVNVPLESLREYNILHFKKIIDTYQLNSQYISNNIFFISPFNLITKVNDYLLGQKNLESDYFINIDNLFSKYGVHFTENPDFFYSSLGLDKYIKKI